MQTNFGFNRQDCSMISASQNLLDLFFHKFTTTYRTFV